HSLSSKKSRLETISLRLAPLALFCLILHVSGQVGYHYFRRVENNPFRAAAEVVKIEDDRIVLADGRAFRPLGGVDGELRESIQDSQGRVGLEVDEEGVVT